MRDTCVYFMKPVGMDGPIKIGLTHRPLNRLSELAAWSPFPLEIITSIPGDLRTEQNIQNCFYDLRTHKEWFRADKRLIDAVAKLKAGVLLHEAVDLTDLRGDIAADHYARRSKITAEKRGKPYRPRERPPNEAVMVAPATA